MKKLYSVLIAAVFATVSFGSFAASHGGAMKDDGKMMDKKMMDKKTMEEKMAACKKMDAKADEKMKAECKKLEETKK